VEFEVRGVENPAERVLNVHLVIDQEQFFHGKAWVVKDLR
jgi:hypothetical protein